MLGLYHQPTQEEFKVSSPISGLPGTVAKHILKEFSHRYITGQSNMHTKAAQTYRNREEMAVQQVSLLSFPAGWSRIKALTSPELLRNKEVLQLLVDSLGPQDDCSGIETAEDDLGFPPQVKSYLSTPHLTALQHFQCHHSDVLGFHGQVLWMETEPGQRLLNTIFALPLPN